MADDKKTELSIVVRTIDQATAKIKAINDRLKAVAKPARDFEEQLGKLKENSGLDKIVDGFHGVTSAIGDLISKAAMIGGVVGLAGAAVFKLVGEFDDLGDKAERFGVSVDFLASMRYAAEKAGAPVEALDAGLQAFGVNMGKLSANTGRFKKFLDIVSPALEQQMKKAKSNEEAFYLLAAAMDKVKDPAKRMALAQAAGLGPELAPLLAQGEKGVKKLVERYQQLAPGMADAAAKAGETDDAMHDLHASMDGVKAGIVSGLAPALTVLVKQLTEWLSGHQAEIKQWAADIGERLPGAVHAVVDAVKGAVEWIADLVDSIGGVKVVAVALAAILAGPLLLAIGSFGVALMATPFGWFLAGIAAVVAGVAAAVKGIEWLAKKGRWVGEKLAYQKLVEQHMNEYREQNQEAIDAGEITQDDIRQQAEKMAAYDIAASHAKEDADDKRAQDLINGQGGNDPVADLQAQMDAIKAANAFGQTALARNIASALAGVLNDPKKKQSEVKVSFTNAPPGTRVNTASPGGGGVDLSVGYQIGATP